VAKFQPGSQKYFPYFFPNGSWRIISRKPNNLHGNRAASANDSAFIPVLFYGAGNRRKVYTPVRMKMAIFKFKQSHFKTFGHSVAAGKTPLPVGGNAGGKQFSFPVQQYRTRVGQEQFPGKSKGVPQQEQACESP
jgi:hypothetical protein